MSAIFPATGSRTRTATPQGSRETHDAARLAVRQLLERSEAFHELPADKREVLAKGLVQIGAYLAEPDGVRLKQQSAPVHAMAGDDSTPLRQQDQPEFGQALKTGVQQAGALMAAVNFPTFVSGLINGVFHSIVGSTIEQMEAYAKLVADVSKSLNQFRDDNTTQNQGRDHLVEQFPDLFQLQMGDDAFGDFGGSDSGAPPQPRVVMRQDVDERAAVARVNQSLPLDKPVTSLNDDLVEAVLVPAARTQIATGRQQLLATLVMLGINRIVVTDGRISAKVLYDFQARDDSRYRYSATKMDHQKDMFGNVQKTRGYEGDYDYKSDGGTYSRSADGSSDKRDGSYYAKGSYKYNEQPIIKMSSTSQLQNDSSLQAKASLAGQVEVNFKSDYLPLEKLANPESIAAIQMNAQPGMVKSLATNRPGGNAATPAAAAPATPPAA